MLSGIGGVRENAPGISGVHGVVTGMVGVSGALSGIGGVRGAFSGNCVYCGAGSGIVGVCAMYGSPAFSGSVGVPVHGEDWPCARAALTTRGCGCTWVCPSRIQVREGDTGGVAGRGRPG